MYSSRLEAESVVDHSMGAGHNEVIAKKKNERGRPAACRTLFLGDLASVKRMEPPHYNGTVP